ncbi:hypothetical protein MARPU_14425 [Marichromatium purpuratum 984]|uniref:Uncharacterized protein n=1 Tax=Marichromatium purpuratum 984 TaxID=765910 RepID=W0E991_MARPU|nr:hypothetical protein MARPU_14425 [Marichromatium purpuratum 984]
MQRLRGLDSGRRRLDDRAVATGAVAGQEEEAQRRAGASGQAEGAERQLQGVAAADVGQVMTIALGGAGAVAGHHQHPPGGETAVELTLEARDIEHLCREGLLEPQPVVKLDTTTDE